MGCRKLNSYVYIIGYILIKIKGFNKVFSLIFNGFINPFNINILPGFIKWRISEDIPMKFS